MKRFLKWWTFDRLVILLLALNVIDAASTHILLLRGGPEVELNPLMRWAWTVSPDLFWTLKLVLVSGGLAIIGKLADERMARRITTSAIAFYLVVIGTHVQGWFEALA